MTLSIIIPALNEEQCLTVVLHDVIEILHGEEYEYEIIVVNDSSIDATREAVLNFQSEHRNIILIDRKGKRGLGRSVKEGFKYAKGTIILIVMGDLADDIGDVPNMVKKIVIEGYDFVCGSRYTQDGRGRHNNILKGFLSKMLARAIYYVCKIPTLDAPNTFKMFRKEILERIGRIESNHYTIALELVLRAYDRGYRIIDIPTIWNDRRYGKTNFVFFAHGWQYLKWFVFALFIYGKKHIWYRL